MENTRRRTGGSARPDVGIIFFREKLRQAVAGAGQGQEPSFRKQLLHAVAVEDLSARVETDRDLPAVDLLLKPAHAPRGSFRADAGPVRALVRGEDDPSDPLHGGGTGHADALLQGLRPSSLREGGGCGCP